MKALFNFTEALRNELESNALINSTSLGDLSEVAIMKRDVFPMAHTVLTTGTISSATSQLYVSILFLDVVDENPVEDSGFYGNDNESYIHNSMLAAATKTYQEMARGDLYAQGYQVEDDAEIEFFSERFEDKLAGVAISFYVTINNNIELCV